MKRVICKFKDGRCLNVLADLIYKVGDHIEVWFKEELVCSALEEAIEYCYITEQKKNEN